MTFEAIGPAETAALLLAWLDHHGAPVTLAADGGLAVDLPASVSEMRGKPKVSNWLWWVFSVKTRRTWWRLGSFIKRKVGAVSFAPLQRRDEFRTDLGRLVCDVCQKRAAVFEDADRPALVCGRCRRQHNADTNILVERHGGTRAAS